MLALVPTPARPTAPEVPLGPAQQVEYQAKVASVLDRARKIEVAHGGRKQHLATASYLSR